MKIQVVCSNSSCGQSLVCSSMFSGKRVKCPHCGTHSILPQLETAINSEGTRMGGYSLVRVVGEGSMGRVYEAIQDGLNRRVALKLLRTRFSRDPDNIRRFHREARVVATLNHRNIVKVFEIGEQDEVHYISIEYADGETLKEKLKSGLLPPDEALGYLVQAARALAHAWEHKIIHRDIKPGNLLVNSDGTLKMTDFGLAQFLAHTSETGDYIAGTPFYMSPEQANGEKELDIRTDIYSLGATFYHLLTGHPPFKGRSLFEAAQKLAEHHVTPVRELRPELSEYLGSVIDKMMAKNFEDRYQDPLELLSDLDEVRFDMFYSSKEEDADLRLQLSELETVYEEADENSTTVLSA